ncbi:unnamed protein product [Alopecurus aequalis]
MDCGTDELHQHGHGCDGGGDLTEWKKVAELRSVVEAQDPASKEEDDFVLRRFLRARDHNIGKASTMLLQYISWKRDAKPHGSISDDEVRDEIAKERVQMQGFDRLRRPMVYLYGARHFPARRDLDNFKRYVAYCLDKICTRLPKGQEKFAAVIDLKGWGYSNCDIHGYAAALNIMQSYYPERLGRVFLIHVPYMFMAAWKMVYPFIDERTRKKIVFVADKNLDATLHDAIDDSQLLEEYGGKLTVQGYNNSLSSKSSKS